MKAITPILFAPAIFLSACAHDDGVVVDLTKTAMNFNLEGADLGANGLVSQFEKGRSSSSQAAGGG